MVRFFSFLLLISLFFVLPAASSEPAYVIDDEYKDEYDSFLESIPKEISGMLPHEIYSDDVSESAKGIIAVTAPEKFLDIIIDLVGLNIGEGLRIFASLIALIFISGCANNLFKSSSFDALQEPFSLCISAAMMLVFIGEQMKIVRMVDLFLTRLLTMVNSMIPLIGVLYSVGGNVSTAASGTASLSAFIWLCENIFARTLFPVVGISLALSVASAFSSHLSFGEISSSVRRIYTYSSGLLMALMAFVMGVQNQLSAKADSAFIRAGKYALGSFIPIVGGAVGDSLRTVGAGVEYIRTSVGSLGIIMIIILLLPALISLGLVKGAVNLSSSLAKLIGCEREGKMLSELGSIYGYMMAVCSICSVLFIYALTLFVKCSAAGG
ncbi:MAG: hypothetical protein IJ303_04075 [Clostridia bacterium]|nr:hypothetical protein [Clostridia bacterium]